MPISELKYISGVQECQKHKPKIFLVNYKLENTINIARFTKAIGCMIHYVDDFTLWI